MKSTGTRPISKQSVDVLISGAGTPGLVLGLLLVNAGLDVLICDPALPVPPADIKPTGRTSALMAGSVEILGRAGLGAYADEFGSDLKILSINDGNVRHDFSCEEIGLLYFGKNIPNDLLQSLAYLKFRQAAHADFIQGKIESFKADESGADVTLSTGAEITCRLIIGADGRNSAVRMLNNIDVTGHDYGQMAITGLISHTRPHQYASTEFHRSGGPFTLVPLKGNQSSFVWVEKTDDAEKFMTLSRQDFEKALQERSENTVGKITLVTSPQAWPLKLQGAKSLIAKRSVLIAEAAHVISPIGAQGMNLSLRDAFALSEMIIDHARLGLDFGSDLMLRKYENERRADTNIRLQGTDIYNRIVATNSGFLGALRKLSFDSISKVKPLRQLAMREGLTASYSSFSQDILSGLTTRAKARTSTRAAPAA